MNYYEEPNVTIYQGHALDILKGMSPESVDCVITSPPYWGLRTYKTEPQIWGVNHCEHEWGELPPRRSRKVSDIKDLDSKEATNAGNLGLELPNTNFCFKCNAWRGELGLEPTIEPYISHLLQIFDEVKRVLKTTGTCWVNIGDSYAGGKGQSGCGDAEYQANRTDVTLSKPYHQMGGHGLIRPADGKIGVPAKSLCLIPERFALGMVQRHWLLRNNIIWYKSNPMPGSVKDRFTGTYEYLYFFVKSKRYWFEQQLESVLDSSLKRAEYGLHNTPEGQWAVNVQIDKMGERFVNPLGRNKRDVWEINTKPYPEAHFATFPEKLVETPILAGCPSAICKKCGKARERIYAQGELVPDAPQYKPRGRNKPELGVKTTMTPAGSKQGHPNFHYQQIDKGYSDCGCNAGFEPGVVLDPFAGSGATGAVAKRFARKYIGIELSEKYCELHKKRLQAVPLAMGLI